jgi:hypothetical protein
MIAHFNPWTRSAGSLAAFVILTSPLAAFAKKPDPATFTLSIHVRETEVDYACNESFLGNPASCGMRLRIIGVLEGQKLQLRANTSMVLRTGDYKMREKKEEPPPYAPDPSYVDRKAYEMLLPDGKVIVFQVVGESQD